MYMYGVFFIQYTSMIYIFTGVPAAYLCTPADVIKTRLQVNAVNYEYYSHNYDNRKGPTVWR